MLFNEVRQINLTPTLALALGIPIPYSNLGIAILEIFENEKTDVIKANYLQVILTLIKALLLRFSNVFFFNISQRLNNLLSDTNISQAKNLLPIKN
jgi:hypothetical protein